MNINHFLTLSDWSAATLRELVDSAISDKKNYTDPRSEKQQGRMLALLFDQPSTRTRVSFTAAMARLGGQTISLTAQDTQIGRGETLADTARVLSRMVDIIVMRTHEHHNLLELAAHSGVPVINGLTNHSHPCQVLADIMTFEEARGDISGRKIAWVGDGNNVCQSFIEAAHLFGFHLHVATPRGREPDETFIMSYGHSPWVHLGHDPVEAVLGADLVVTDVWVSMGDKSASQDALKLLMKPYQVNAGLMNLARSDALFMHCLPVHREEEVTAEVIDGSQSIVWDEAENRLHIQKALLKYLLSSN